MNDASTANTSLTILIAGASGMIGRALVTRLTNKGHTVRRLVRREAASVDEVPWSPSEGRLNPATLDDIDAIINFAGASIMHFPWTEKYRTIICDSRVESTQTIVDAMGKASTPPAILLSSSAAGFYGSRPGEKLTEDSPRGTGFLSDVTAAWEGAALDAPAGTRIVLFRTGIVLGAGGVLDVLRTPTLWGVAGPIAGGHQHWPWISLHDEVAAIDHLLSSSLRGPVNLVGPTPATAGDIMRHIAKDLHRPYWLPLPGFAARLALQDAANDLILVDQNVTPSKLLEDGFTWKYGTAEHAIDAAIANDSAQ